MATSASQRTNIKKEIGKRIKALRAIEGLTQIEFARALSVNPKTVVFWEKGYSSISLEFLSSICQTFPENIRILGIDVLANLITREKHGNN